MHCSGIDETTELCIAMGHGGLEFHQGVVRQVKGYTQNTAMHVSEMDRRKQRLQAATYVYSTCVYAWKQ